MRLWHKYLIEFLPRQQLTAQWRECVAIARNIAVKGTPNHILVNPIMDYPLYNFVNYSYAVYTEMTARGYRCDWSRMQRWIDEFPKPIGLEYKPLYSRRILNSLFKGWHDDVYLKECLNNLEEKYFRGGITRDEWSVIFKEFDNRFELYFR